MNNSAQGLARRTPLFAAAASCMGPLNFLNAKSREPLHDHRRTRVLLVSR